LKIGLPGDKRRFKRSRKKEGVTKHIKDEKARWPRCCYCGLEITGKSFRVSETEECCFRCHNE